MPRFRQLPPIKTIEEYEAEIDTRHPDLAHYKKKPTPPQSIARPIDCIALGVDDGNQVLRVEDRVRLEHMHVIGATGCGKSTFLLNCILQDISRGRGVCVLDPHGGHPDSLLNMVMRFLQEDYEARDFRQELIDAIEHPQAKQDLQYINRLSKDRTGLTDFNATVLGPTNRLVEFLACEAMRLMFSTTRAKDDRTIDILDIINRGHILLVDLQHGPRVDEAATDLLGKIILRYLFMLMTRRKPYVLPGTTEEKYHPFYVYVDEAHRYVTEDVESLLTEARKFGVGVTLAHQYLAQLGKPEEKIYDAVRNSTETKVVFRVKSPEEAQTLAYDVLPLSLEVPVQASIRPTQIGSVIGTLNNETYAVHEGEGESEAVHAAEGTSRGRTELQTWASALSRASGTSIGSGSASSFGRGLSEGAANTIASMESMTFSYDPNTQTFLAVNLPLGMNIGSADSASQSLLISKNEQRAESLNRFEALSETEGRTDSEGGALGITDAITASRGKSLAKSKTHGNTKGQGTSEAPMPVYSDLPTSFHSKDNELYMKGEMIRNLPVGRAVIKYRAASTCITVPPPRKSTAR